MTAVTVRAPAKINLQLAVGPRRADRYHDLVTIFQAISLYDDVTVTETDGPGEDRVLVSGEGAGAVPGGRDNLALKAAAALTRAAGLPRDPDRRIEITIRKRIPVAAGLAGGSADAAAALVACNELWHAGLSHEQLTEVAAAVGSDVAFALLGGTAVGQGRGEQLAPALASGEYHWVLAVADGALSTPKVYAAFDRLNGPDVREPALHHALMAALRSGHPAAVGDASERPAAGRGLTVPSAAQDPRGRPRARRAGSDGGGVRADLRLSRRGRETRRRPGGSPFRRGGVPGGGPHDRPGARRIDRHRDSLRMLPAW